jgi:hypothetical protein
MHIRSASKQTQPSYKAGYAKSASESAYPELWDGLVGAWMPSLGVTGIERVFDVIGRNHGVIADSEAGDIKPNYLHLDADGGGTFGEYMRADQQQMTLPFTLTSRARLTDPAEPMFFFSAYQRNDSGRYYHALSGSTDGKITVSSRDRFDLDSDASVSGLFEVGEWVNVVAVFREDRHDAYLNGRHVAGGTVTAGLNADMILVGTLRLDFSAARGTGDFSSVLYHDRALSPKEIQDLNADPLAPFRQRRYAPVSLQTEEPPTETANSGLIRLKSPKRSEPSYKAGYAKSASESANPNLWDGLAGAWMPSLGVTGSKIPEVTGKATDAYLQNVPETNWMTDRGKTAVLLDGGSSNDHISAAYCDAFNFGSESFTAISLLNYRTLQLVNSINAFLDFRAASSGNVGFHTYLRSNGVFQTQLRSSSVQDQYAHNVPVNNNEWQMFATRVDREKQTCETFLDGKNYGSSSISSSMGDINSGEPARFGINITDQYESNALFAGVLIYKRALSDAEIKQLYADPLAPFRQRRYAPFSLTTEEPPTTFNHWYALPGRIHRFIGLGVHV